MEKNFLFRSVKVRELFILFFIFCIFFPGSTGRADDQTPPRELQHLNLSGLDGEVRVYYSAGYKKRAQYLQGLAGESSSFLQKPENLGINLDLILAVLGPEDWAKFTKLPYGVSHIIGSIPMAILPASEKNVISQGFIKNRALTSNKILKKLEQLGISFEEAAATFVDLIGFHEIGHIYAFSYNIETWPREKWLGEFVATYLAYAFMKNSRPKLARLWEVMTDSLAERRGYKYTTLADFEKLYIQVGTGNYGWYQARFQQLVSQVFEKMGMKFIHTLKNIMIKNARPAKDDPFRLTELDGIYNVFSEWAKGPQGNLVKSEPN